MKKYTTIFLLIAAILCFSCSRTGDVSEENITSDSYSITLLSAELGDSQEMTAVANNAAVASIFTLDFRPLKPEGDNEAEILSAADLAGAQSANAGQGTVVGGGLRRLNQYKTAYFDPEKEKARIEAIRLSQEEAAREHSSSPPGPA